MEVWENSRSMVYRFHDYILDPAGREVRHGAHRLALEPKVFQVLLYLLEHRDRVVPKAELLEQCWPGTFVSEAALTRCLARLRQAVQALPTAPPVIATRHRQGYRFVADVTVLAQMSSPAPVDTSPRQVAHAVPLVSPDTPPPPAPLHSAPLPVRSDLQSSPAAERRQLTVLLCDVVDSTTMAGQLDPEDFREVMVRYHATCTEVIERYGGHIAQYLGDGLLVYFGWPQAHEDDARRAVHTGLALVTAIRALGHRLVQDYGLRLALRIGMHTGLVVVGTGEGGAPHGQLAVGATPNLAAKMQSLAAPDTVVMSDTTAQLVQGYFVCEPLGEHLLPGTTEPGVLYQVRGASGVQGRLDVTAPQHLTPFVGREVELAVLRERAAQVRQGLGQVVLLSGDAGIGKSRLAQEVTTTVVADGFTCIACRCSPYSQHTALHPLIEWLQRCLQDDAETPVAARLVRLETLVQQAQLDGHAHVPLLAALVQLDLPDAHYPALQLTPQQQRQRTLDTLLALVVGLAARQAVLCIVEDLHWADPTTLEWLGLLMAQGPTAPLFTLLTCRPTFASPWSSRGHVTLLSLPRLASPQVEQIVHALAGDVLPAAQRQHIVRQTDGVPLFIEEVTKFILTAQRLHGQTGRPASSSPAPEVAIPATLRDSLMARLDQLGPAKGTAQLGATMGREFPYALLQAVTPLEEDLLRQDLYQLVAAELLYQRGVGATAVYQFKHALIQEAAYGSLLRRTRQHYHQHIMQVLEAQFPDTVATQLELLAHHALCGEVWDKALAYCRQAGEKALTQSAYREAVGYFEQALSALPHLPETHDMREQAIDLRFALRTALLPSGNAERILAYLHEAEALATIINDPHRLGRVSRFLSVHFSATGAYDRAITTARHALVLATTSGEVGQQVLANECLGLAYHAQGDYRQAIACYRQAVVSLDKAQHRESFGQVMLPAVNSRSWLAWCHAELGMFAEGRAFGEEGLQIAAAVDHPASLMRASLGIGRLCLRQGDLSRALPRLERAVDICREADLSLYFPQIAPALGVAYALSGRVTDAVPLLTQAIEQIMATGMVLFQALCCLSLGEVHRLAGRFEDAQALAERALVLARERQERSDQAYALHLLGDIAARYEPPATKPAEAHYQHALALAGELGMRPLQAHCHLALGTLYATLGRLAPARTALATAIKMYRAMDMIFWLYQAEAALAQVLEG